MNAIDAHLSAAVDIRRVSKTFGYGSAAFTALDDVGISIRHGETVAIFGPSGSGKTVLLRLIAGMNEPEEGHLLINGQDMQGVAPENRAVGMAFQNYALFPHMSVADNIGFGLRMLGRPKAEIAATVDEMLRLVRMEPMRDRMTSAISGGQQQRVALARALAPRPKVLLLDEPLSALDLKLRREMQVELKRLQGETGITFVFVTHDQDEAMAMSDRMAVMSAGRVHQVGAPRDIYDRPESRFVADFIGETNFFEAEILGREGNFATARMAGITLRAAARPGLAASAKALVVVRPEHLSLVPAGTPDAIPGTIASTTFTGADTLVLVAIPGRAAPIGVRVANGPASVDCAGVPAPGSPVALAVAPGGATLLGEGA